MRSLARLSCLIPALVLAITVAAGFGRLVLKPHSLIVDAQGISRDERVKPADRSIGNDLTRLFLPHHLRIGRWVQQTGRIPGWDPAGFAGRPLIGNPQAGLWYPGAWLAWWRGRPCSLGWITVGHLLWAGLGVMWLGRASGLAVLPAFLAGCCYALAPYTLAQVQEGHYPHVWVAAWYPWAFLALAAWRQRLPGSTVTLGLVLALALLAGHPQEAYYLGVVLAAVACWQTVFSLKSHGPRSAAARMGGWLVALAVLVGLTAVEWLPDRLAQPYSLAARPLTPKELSHYHWQPLNLLQLLGPRALGGPADFLGHENFWETQLSIGWVPLVMVAVALGAAARDARTRRWALLASLTILFAGGYRLGFFRLMYEIVPGMDRFRVPARALYLFNLAASMLAGLGLERLTALDGEGLSRLARRYRRVALFIAALVLLGTALAARFREPPPSALPQSSRPDLAADALNDWERVLRASANLSRDPLFWAMLAGLAAVVEARRLGALTPRTAALLCCGLVISELVLNAQGTIKIAEIGPLMGGDPVSERLAVLDRHRLSRLRARDSFYGDLRAIALGFEKSNLNDYFQIQHAADLYEHLYPLCDHIPPRELADPVFADQQRKLRQAILDRMNIAWLVTDRPETIQGYGQILTSGTWNSANFVIARNLTVLPRAYVVPRALEVDAHESVLEALADTPAREAVLMDRDPLAPGIPRQQYKPAALRLEAPDRVSIQVETKAPGLLVIASTWMPGWKALVDGAPEPVLRGNRAQRVVPIRSPGYHRISLWYDPPGFRMGRAISLLTALAAATLLLLEWLIKLWRDRLRANGENTSPSRPAQPLAQPPLGGQ